jgi:hypothetical protein
MIHAAKNAVQVLLAIIISFGIWEAIGLNRWTAALRQRDLYFMYQILFLVFLLFFFFMYLQLRKERAKQTLPLFCFGFVAGYVASLLALCFWPLLAPKGWDRFLHMTWGLVDLPFDCFVIAGWLNGLILAGVLWIVKQGDARKQAAVLAVGFVLLAFRYLFV